MLEEATLLSIGPERVVPETLEYDVDVVDVIVSGFAKDEDVVQVNDDEEVEIIPQYIVDEILEGCWSVCETKRHDKVFKEAIACAEGGFPLITRGYADEVVGRSEVDFAEPGCLLESVERFLNEREWVTVLACDFVETTVIHAESKRAITLFDEEDGCARWTGTRLDEALLEIIFEIVVQSFELNFRQGVDRPKGWLRITFKRDGMVVSTVSWELVGVGLLEDLKMGMELGRNEFPEC
jgi:hypothetical protein